MSLRNKISAIDINAKFCGKSAKKELEKACRTLIWPEHLLWGQETQLKMASSLQLCNVVLEKYFERPEELDTLFKMMLVLNGLFSFTAVLGNLSIMFALKKASSIPSSTQILLKCLAVTDLGNGVLGHPLYMVVISRLRQSYTCENNHQILLAFLLIETSLCTASFITVTFIGVDRFLAISLHLRYNELVTPKRVAATVLTSWIVVLATTIIGAFWFLNIGEMLILINGYISTLLLSIIYIRLFSVARRHVASINSQTQVTAHLSSIRKMARNKTLAIKTFYVFVIFLLCYCPYLICLTVLLLSSQPNAAIKGAAHLTLVLWMLNSSLNPVVFGWKLKEVRQIVNNDFKKIIPCKSNDWDLSFKVCFRIGVSGFGFSKIEIRNIFGRIFPNRVISSSAWILIHRPFHDLFWSVTFDMDKLGKIGREHWK